MMKMSNSVGRSSSPAGQPRRCHLILPFLLFSISSHLGTPLEQSMNPLSSIPPTPQRDASLPPMTETVLSSHDASNDVSVLSLKNSTKDAMLSHSTSSQEISYYLGRLSQIPDVRQAKIAQIQKAIDSQTYAIPAEKLADSLIQELHPHPQEIRPPTSS